MTEGGDGALVRGGGAVADGVVGLDGGVEGDGYGGHYWSVSVVESKLGV